MRKSLAAVFMVASLSTTLSEKVMPVGLEYFGTHQMPLMESSSLTRASMTSISGPSSFMRTVIISMPNCWHMEKWRS